MYNNYTVPRNRCNSFCQCELTNNLPVAGAPTGGRMDKAWQEKVCASSFFKFVVATDLLIDENIHLLKERLSLLCISLRATYSKKCLICCVEITGWDAVRAQKSSTHWRYACRNRTPHSEVRHLTLSRWIRNWRKRGHRRSTVPVCMHNYSYHLEDTETRKWWPTDLINEHLLASREPSNWRLMSCRKTERFQIVGHLIRSKKTHEL